MAHLYGLARLGRDAELRSTTAGEQVASLSLAFTYGRKGDDGKRPTQWVDGALWGKRAEALTPYLKKGGLVVVTLEDLHVATFKKSDGSEGVKLAGRVIAVDLAGGNDRAAAPPAPPAPAPKPAAGSGFDDMSDDAPW
jgi:single-strand DNA-binding protein